ncbi:MAG: hypothetical protein ACFB51_19410 [Anaerolineae bacterium]
MGLPLLAALRGMNGEADFIVREPGHTGGLAAQGLPAVTAVDAKPCAQHDPPGAGEDAEAPAA